MTDKPHTDFATRVQELTPAIRRAAAALKDARDNPSPTSPFLPDNSSSMPSSLTPEQERQTELILAEVRRMIREMTEKRISFNDGEVPETVRSLLVSKVNKAASLKAQPKKPGHQ